MKPIVSLQCMRAIAAILVVVFHHMNTLRDGPAPDLPRFDLGEFGVDIFFIISGFIMWTTTARQRTTGLQFLSRRIVRIVPLYWVLTLVTVFVSTRAGLSLNLDIEYPRLIKSLLFIPQWHHYFPIVAPSLIVGWTLESEMLFYVIIAAALPLAAARRVWVVPAILAALTAAGLLFSPQIAVLKGWTNEIIMEFALGLWLGRLHELERAPRTTPAGLALIAAGIALALFHAQLPALRFIYFGIPALLIMSGVLALEPYFVGSTFRLPKFLGDASYSIYLSHLMAMALSTKVVSREFAGAHRVVTLFVEITFAVAVGCAVYVFLEKPLTQAVKRLFTTSAPRESVARST